DDSVRMIVQSAFQRIHFKGRDVAFYCFDALQQVQTAVNLPVEAGRAPVVAGFGGKIAKRHLQSFSKQTADRAFTRLPGTEKNDRIGHNALFLCFDPSTNAAAARLSKGLQPDPSTQEQ